MAFEPVFEETKLDSIKRICSSQAVVEARMLPSSGALISRVLSIATDCVVSPSEVFAGEARYNGRVCFKMVYVDKEGANHSMDYNADFTDKLTSDKITSAIRPIISANILDTDIVNVDEREIKLACVLEVNLDAVVTDSANILTQGGDGIYTHDDKLEFTRLVSEASENIVISDTLADVRATDILLCEPKIIITRAKAGMDSAVVEGRIICDICCEDADGMIASYQSITAFMQEISLVGALDTHIVIANGSMVSHKAVLETDDTSGAVNLEYSVALSVMLFSEESVNPIVDAFSITHELLQAGESLKVFKNHALPIFSDRVDGAVTLDINMPIADNILAITGARLNIANVAAGDAKITYEGVASCNIIYYSAEQNSKNSVAVELPFSFSSNASVDEGDEISAHGIVTKVTAKIRRGNEIDIKADIEIVSAVTSSETKYVITELKAGEERALPTSAFSIHIARGGETLWEVAKSLGTTPELVLLQNPSLSLPLTSGERVIAYRNLKA